MPPSSNMWYQYKNIYIFWSMKHFLVVTLYFFWSMKHFLVVTLYLVTVVCNLIYIIYLQVYTYIIHILYHIYIHKNWSDINHRCIDLRLGEDEGLYEKQGENNEPLRRRSGACFSRFACRKNIYKTYIHLYTIYRS